MSSMSTTTESPDTRLTNSHSSALTSISEHVKPLPSVSDDSAFSDKMDFEHSIHRERGSNPQNIKISISFDNRKNDEISGRRSTKEQGSSWEKNNATLEKNSKPSSKKSKVRKSLSLNNKKPNRRSPLPNRDRLSFVNPEPNQPQKIGNNRLQTGLMHPLMGTMPIITSTAESIPETDSIEKFEQQESLKIKFTD